MAEEKRPRKKRTEYDEEEQEEEEEEESDGPENLQYKIVILGNGTVGKTSIIMRLCEDYFAKSYKQTIGVDFFVKRLEMPEEVQVAL